MVDLKKSTNKWVVMRKTIRGKILKTAIISKLVIGGYICFSFAQTNQFVLNNWEYYADNNQLYQAKLASADKLIADNNSLRAIEEYEKIVENYPHFIMPWKKLAELYIQQRMPERAIECCEKVIELDPVDIGVMKKLAELYLADNRRKDAIDMLEKVLMFEIDNLKIHKKLAQLYSMNNMPEKTISQYEKIVHLDLKDTETMRKLAFNYLCTNQPLKGIKLLEKILRVYPDSSRIRKELAQQYVSLDMPNAALSHYEKIVELNPSDFEYKKILAQQYLQHDRTTEALPICEEIVQNEPDNMDFRMQLAKIYISNMQQREAEIMLQQVINSPATNFEALLLLAQLEYDSQKWVSAKDKLAEILLFQPDNSQALKIMQAIRSQYNPKLELKFERISDSNQIIREQIPVGMTYFQNKSWAYRIAVSECFVSDGKLNTGMNGTALNFATIYNFSLNGFAELGFGAVGYSSGWLPFSLQFRFTQRFFDRINVTANYRHQEARNGVRALENEIRMQSVSGEIFWQTKKRLRFLGKYIHQSFTDMNSAKSAAFNMEYDLMLENPRIRIKADYTYDDCEHIYPNALPYWTPDNLKGLNFGFSIAHHFGSWSDVELGYTYASQNSTFCHNFSGQIGIRLTPFDKLNFQYIKDGSDFYRTEKVQVFFQHRF